VSLTGKIALVTGAGRGIGRAIALALADAGATSALVARTEGELTQTAKLVEESGGTALAVVADLGDPASVASVVERTVSELGPVDLLINNAASVEPLGPSAGMNPTAWAASFDINVIAPASLSFALLPHMIKAGWGRIVNVSSGIVARPAALIGGNAYAATKGALEAHTLNLAAELDGTGVTANIYRPGVVDTSMQALLRREGGGRMSQETHAQFVRYLEQGMLLTPDESARSLVERLGSDDSGQIWDVSDPR
jgi:NAD(P)-dependent dehydrogenase (short-subunit alcohol dehydrogenase family)